MAAEVGKGGCQSTVGKPVGSCSRCFVQASVNKNQSASWTNGQLQSGRFTPTPNSSFARVSGQGLLQVLRAQQTGLKFYRDAPNQPKVGKAGWASKIRAIQKQSDKTVTKTELWLAPRRRRCLANWPNSSGAQPRLNFRPVAATKPFGFVRRRLAAEVGKGGCQPPVGKPVRFAQSRCVKSGAIAITTTDGDSSKASTLQWFVRFSIEDQLLFQILSVRGFNNKTPQNKAGLTNLRLIRHGCSSVMNTTYWKIVKKRRYEAIRPLLNLSRESVTTLCKDLRLPIYPDISNKAVQYSRNRLREQILPDIKLFFNPQIEDALFKLADLLTQDFSVVYHLIHTRRRKTGRP